ncbi:UNVERIFIED_CONTAM: hypothetical protein Sradi_7100800 [Sesamum radiatum]|uniref:Reverse transcriptase zinc-binding domain-containing protein n=1 Tax=Sesamum radiatum TaxID=300843 RepID=A0AAW2J3X9_SESRA
MVIQWAMAWPSEFDFDIQQIMSQLPVIHVNQPDKIIWKAGTFSTHSVFALLQPPSVRVFWHQLLGGKFSLPRHDCFLWLAVLERLSTLDRIWVSTAGQSCVLCGGQQRESHCHLFFQCSYSKCCLLYLKRYARFQWPNRGWQCDVLWAARRWRGGHLLNEAARALLASIVYHLWCERNNRIFSSSAVSLKWLPFRAWRMLGSVLYLKISSLVCKGAFYFEFGESPGYELSCTCNVFKGLVWLSHSG